MNFSADATDWQRLNEREQDLLLRLTDQLEGGDELLPMVLDHIQQTLSVYGCVPPFGVTVIQFLEIGSAQAEKRLGRIERAHSQTLDEVLYAPRPQDPDRPFDTRPARPSNAS
jgi:hypothetical protein